jgi:hypothetical protein
MVLDSSHTEPWLVPLGKFILNFGAIELMSLVWTAELGRDDVLLDLANDMPLSKRLVLISTLVRRSSLAPTLEEEVLEKWNAVERLSKVRNALAHGPIMYGWHDEKEVGPPDYIGCVSIRKLKSKNGVPEGLVEFQTLFDAVDESAHLVVAMGPLLDQVRQSLA